MSISGALSNAYSGLAASSRTAETVSNNVSNAMTDGYSRQQVEYTARVTGSTGSGVRVNGAVRTEDAIATSARRRAETDLHRLETLSNATNRLADSLGEPGSNFALATRFSSFENAINASVNAPDSIALQKSILAEATQLTESFNRISQETSRIRMNADATISRQVNEVNASLKQIENLNSEIRLLSKSGRSVAALEDQRQMLVDKVNTIIPIKQSQVSEGEIAIFTDGGEILLDRSARELGFSPAGMIVPSMSLSLGSLSGLTINGQPAAIGVEGGMLEGGSLASNFKVRDEIAPKFHKHIDALARDLVERFQDSNVDLTLLPGDAGLFSDGASAFNPAKETGLADRISVNSAVDPSQGGNVWRLRDGINAMTPGLAGDATQLLRMSDAFISTRPPQTGMDLTVAANALDFSEEITSVWALEAANIEIDTASWAGLFATLKTEELNATGVDTDREMQTLLLVEKSYAANARVISVIDGLMKTLLEM